MGKRGFPPKKINQYFFDKESKAMYYVLGAFYGGYTPRRENGVKFTSSNKDLVEIVKEQLESRHSITSDSRGKNSHWLEIYSAPYLHSKLEELRVGVPKAERTFPRNIDEEYVSHFVRGFLDAQSNIQRYNKKVNIIITYNNQFLTDLNNVIGKYTEIKRKKPKGNIISYGHGGSLKIRDFVYSDWRYITKKKIFLKSNKKKLNTDYYFDKSHNSMKIRCTERIEKAKKLLLEGKPPQEVATEVGYSHKNWIYNAFKNVTGQTIGQFLKKKINK